MYDIVLCVHIHVRMHTMIGNHKPPYMMKELMKQHDQIHRSDLQPQPGYRIRHEEIYVAYKSNDSVSKYTYVCLS